MFVHELVVAKYEDLRVLGYDYRQELKTDEEITELLLKVSMFQKNKPTASVYLSPKAVEIISKIHNSEIYKNYNLCLAFVDDKGNFKTVCSAVEEILNKNKSVELTPDNTDPDPDPDNKVGLRILKKRTNNNPPPKKESVKMIVKGQTYVNKKVQKSRPKEEKEKISRNAYLKAIKSFFKNNKFSSLFTEKGALVSTKQVADAIGIDPQKFCNHLGYRGIYITSYSSKTVKRHCYFSLNDLKSLRKDIVKINVDKIFQLRNYKLTRNDLKYKNEMSCNFFEYLTDVEEEQIKDLSVVAAIREFYKKNNINSLSTKPVVNELKYVIGYNNYYNNSSNAAIIKKYLVANYDAKANNMLRVA